MIKRIAKRLVYTFQFALDYPLYWRMRIALQYTPHNKWGVKGSCLCCCAEGWKQRNAHQRELDYKVTAAPWQSLWYCHMDFAVLL